MSACLICCNARVEKESAPRLSTVGADDTHDVLEVLSARVALGDGGILATEEGADGAADNVGAAEHDSVLASNVDARRLEQEHHSGGGAGREEGSRGARGEQSNVVGVESVV